MFKTSNKYLLLFLILAFSFVYRMLLMHWATFPPGADIGLHNSVIHSITLSGNTNFLWNYYQMGGGLSLTFPGYHIFVSYIMLITGMPDYLAHSLVVSFFSSLIVLCAFLITRTVWGESASLIVAFLVAISRFDVEMLLWGGYPNVITLMLIPLTFYLYLQKAKFSLGPFLAITAILSGAIFLTHSLSAVIFVSITVATVIFVSIFSKRVGVPKTHLFIWLVPLFLGAIIVSPFLLEIVPAYLSVNGETFTGGVSAIRLALLSTKVLPLELVLPLLVCVPVFFLFSKKYKDNFFTVPAFLLAMWVLVPTLLTQGFLVGVYLDYNRFLYFVLLPVIILIGLAIDHGSHFFSRIIDTYLSLTKEVPSTKKGDSKIVSRLMPHLTRKNLYSAFVLGLLLFSFLAVPIFLTPWQGASVSSFYQVMSEPGYEAIQWIRQQTPVGSVLVSDAYYGWWLSGFAQRPTLSAVDPQYLTLTREFEPAKIASSLLDTDYVIDNGLIQVREDGGYIGRHNPMFLAKLNNTYFPYPFFHFNNDEITVEIRDGDGNVQLFDLSQVPVKDMHVENDTSYASIYVTRANQFFNFTQETTIYQGIRFVNMTETIERVDSAVTFSTVRFILHMKGIPMSEENEVVATSVDANMNVAGQLIFTEGQPQTKWFTEENPSCLEMLYNLNGTSKAELKFSVGVYQFEPDTDLNANSPKKLWIEHGQELFANDTIAYMNRAEDLSPDVFDYKTAIPAHEISYIACRDSDVIPKFANDPTFSLVFINDEVAIFMVKRSFNQLGRPPSS
jgi:hypothetical protein